MKKYQEALRRMYELLGKIPFEVELSDLKPLSELVNEKLEQESRKDKLIVGSKWECVANCYCESYGDALKIEKGEITQLQSYHNHTLAISRGIMPTQQFLLCFKPIEKGENK